VSARRGSAVVALVVLLSLLMIVVATMVMAGARDQDLSVQRISTARAFYAAEAAVTLGLREMATDSDLDGDGVIGSVSDDGIATNGPVLNGVRLSASAVGAGGSRTIDALGLSGDAGRRVCVEVESALSAGGGRYGVYAEIREQSPPPPKSTSEVEWGADPIAVSVLPDLNLPSTSGERFAGGPKNKWSGRFTGWLDVPAAGSWTIGLTSDDGSVMTLNGAPFIDNDGVHNANTVSGTATLTEGRHAFEVRYFDQGGQNRLTLSWSGPGVPMEVNIPASAFRCDPPALPLLVANTAIELDGTGEPGSALIDAFDSAQGAYGGSNVSDTAAFVATNATAAQAIVLRNGAQIRGSAAVGPGGNQATGISEQTGSSVTGTRSTLDVLYGVLTPALPARVPASSAGSYSLSAGSATLAASRRYSSVLLDGPATVLTVSGQIVVRCDGDFTVQGGARIEIAPNSSLSLYVSGAVTVSGSGGINRNTGDPTLVLVSMLGDDEDFQLLDQAHFVGRVWNAAGSVVLTSAGDPGCEFFGNAYADSVFVGGRCRVHLDARSNGGVGGPGGGLRVSGWSELDR